MWIASSYGFFSIALSEKEDNCYVLRSPSFQDMERLQVAADLDPDGIKVSESAAMGDLASAAEYKMDTADFFRVMNRFAESVFYTDLLKETSLRPEHKDKLNAYKAIESTMLNWQKRQSIPIQSFQASVTKDDPRFQNRRLFVGAEGGSVNVAECDGLFYVITSDCSLALTGEAEEVEGVYVHAHVFATREARKQFLVQQFGSLIQSWQRNWDWKPSW